jgi:hypothetical protein
MKTYSDKLKDPRWQKERLEIMQRDEFRCRCCGDTETMLSIHHIRYITKKDPWDYDNSMLMTVCNDCHKEIEYFIKHEKIKVDLLNIRVIKTKNEKGEIGLFYSIPGVFIARKWIEGIPADTIQVKSRNVLEILIKIIESSIEL